MAEKIENLEKKPRNIFRQIIKKLSNFRFTAVLVAIISGLAAVYAIVSFILYNYCGELTEFGITGDVRNVGFQSTPTERYLGMVLFFACLFTIVCGIFVVYNLLPAIKNKEKVLPSKAPLIVGCVGTLFQIVVIVLMAKLAFTYEPVPNTQTAMIVSLPFGILLTIGTGLYLVPILCCKFFMPEIKR